MRSPRDRLLDILEAIEKIEIERAKGKANFDSDERAQVWMVHHLMIIGEAVRAIDPAFKARHPGIQWREISAMRNVLVHDYFRINKQIVWATVEKHIPLLKTSVQYILDHE